jgi:D-sedoheptulose 7-phosphate isomerase
VGAVVTAQDPRSRADEYLHAAAGTVLAVAEACLDDIVSAADVMAHAVEEGGKLLICGNGGSAADAQHLATEFVSTFTIDNRRPSIPAVALTTDTSLLTAIANDFGVEGMFARQVESLGKEGDVLVAISTSGTSANVLHAAAAAQQRGLSVVALTGRDGAALAAVADIAVRVPSTVTAHIQESHLAVEQLLASLIEDRLYPRDPPGP